MKKETIMKVAEMNGIKCLDLGGGRIELIFCTGKMEHNTVIEVKNAIGDLANAVYYFYQDAFRENWKRFMDEISIREPFYISEVIVDKAIELQDECDDAGNLLDKVKYELEKVA